MTKGKGFFFLKINWRNLLSRDVYPDTPWFERILWNDKSDTELSTDTPESCQQKTGELFNGIIVCR